MTPSTRSKASSRAFSATGVEAPQSTSNVAFAVSSQKQVLNFPPEPKASPEPMMVSLIVTTLVDFPGPP
jgi:hypothetical protein